MYLPSKKDFDEAATRGNLIPVYREILADGDTPVSAFSKIRTENSFLLESVVGGEKWAAYSFLGVAPRAVIKVRHQEARVTYFDVDEVGEGHEKSWNTEDPTAALAKVLDEWTPVDVPGLPRFWGGAVGWIAYDVVQSFEDLPAPPADKLDSPDVKMVFTDTLVIFDNLRQTIKVVATAFVPDPSRATLAYENAVNRIDRLVEALRADGPGLAPMAPPLSTETGSDQLRWGGRRAAIQLSEARLLRRRRKGSAIYPCRRRFSGGALATLDFGRRGQGDRSF